MLRCWDSQPYSIRLTDVDAPPSESACGRTSLDWCLFSRNRCIRPLLSLTNVSTCYLDLCREQQEYWFWILDRIWPLAISKREERSWVWSEAYFCQPTNCVSVPLHWGLKCSSGPDWTSKWYFGWLLHQSTHWSFQGSVASRTWDPSSIGTPSWTTQWDKATDTHILQKLTLYRLTINPKIRYGFLAEHLTESDLLVFGNEVSLLLLHSELVLDWLQQIRKYASLLCSFVRSLSLFVVALISHLLYYT